MGDERIRFDAMGLIYQPRNSKVNFCLLQEAFEDLFSRVYYLGPRREDPRRYYTWEESHPKDVGQYGEKMISALLSSRFKTFALLMSGL